MKHLSHRGLGFLKIRIVDNTLLAKVFSNLKILLGKTMIQKYWKGNREYIDAIHYNDS